MDDDQPALPLPFHKDVDAMTMVEYLQSVRTLTAEQVDEIEAAKASQCFAPEDVYDAASHHTESHYGAH